MVEWLVLPACCCSPSHACRDNGELPEHSQQGPTGSSHTLHNNDNDGDTYTHGSKGKTTRRAAFAYSPSTWGTEDHASTSVAMSLTQCARLKKSSRWAAPPPPVGQQQQQKNQTRKKNLLAKNVKQAT